MPLKTVQSILPEAVISRLSLKASYESLVVLSNSPSEREYWNEPCARKLDRMSMPAAALKVFETEKLTKTFAKAMQSAYDRSIELGELMGEDK